MIIIKNRFLQMKISLDREKQILTNKNTCKRLKMIKCGKKIVPKVLFGTKPLEKVQFFAGAL